jgi:hypothetical protein
MALAPEVTPIMYCRSCGKQIARGAGFCGACGQPVAAEGLSVVTDKQPIAGIAVAIIVGVIELIWFAVHMFQLMNSYPSGIQADLYRAFPALNGIALFSDSIAMIGYSTLLIGALMGLLRHPKACKTVRITSYCMLVAQLAMAALTLFAITLAPAWLLLDAPTKGSLLGGIIGGALGVVFVWGLLLFLFRRSKWG